MKNVELFQLFAAKAFADLYESFPVVATISPRELAKAGNHDLSERDASIVAEHTLKWLCSTDYLLKQAHAQFTYVLSPKGFEILNASPFSTPEARRPNLGEQLGNAAKEIGTNVGKEELKSLAKQVIELGVGAAFAGIRAHIGM